jgi:hypothetical protein
MSPSQFLLKPPFGHTGTMVFDSTVKSVMWQTGTLRAVDYVVDSYFHARTAARVEPRRRHPPRPGIAPGVCRPRAVPADPEMVDDLWLIAGSPSELGLLRPPWIGAFSSQLAGDDIIPRLKARP